MWSDDGTGTTFTQMTQVPRVNPPPNTPRSATFVLDSAPPSGATWYALVWPVHVPFPNPATIRNFPTGTYTTTVTLSGGGHLPVTATFILDPPSTGYELILGYQVPGRPGQRADFGSCLP